MTTEADQMQGPSGGGGGCEEKISVSVRLRPLNDKEMLRNDSPDWECINSTTIMYRSHLSISDRSMYPSAYSFGILHYYYYYFPSFLPSIQTLFLPSFSLMIILCLSVDRVFGPECCTRQVYDQGAKEVAFSVVSGVNGLTSFHLHFTLPPFYSYSSSLYLYFTWFSASVFAYGQTSSGKTYTMSGITHCTLVDIYDYIDKVN